MGFVSSASGCFYDLPCSNDMQSPFTNYKTDGFYDELFEADGQPRAGAKLLIDRISSLPEGDLKWRQESAEAAMRNLGITFAVYGNEAGTEKVWPFDIIPRIVEAADWQRIAEGLTQRITALNLFTSPPPMH